MGQLIVRDLMTEKVYSIRADEDLARLNDLMADLNIRHVPVVDNDQAVIGVVSQRDLVRSALDSAGLLPVGEQRDFMKNTAVREIMVIDAVTVEPDLEIESAGNLMLENKLGCLPVVENDKLVGILTESDFVKWVVAQQGEG